MEGICFELRINALIKFLYYICTTVCLLPGGNYKANYKLDRYKYIKRNFVIENRKNRNHKGWLTLTMIELRMSNTQGIQCTLSCFLEASQNNNNQ